MPLTLAPVHRFAEVFTAAAKMTDEAVLKATPEGVQTAVLDDAGVAMIGVRAKAGAFTKYDFTADNPDGTSEYWLPLERIDAFIERVRKHKHDGDIVALLQHKGAGKLAFAAGKLRVKTPELAYAPRGRNLPDLAKIPHLVSTQVEGRALKAIIETAAEMGVEGGNDTVVFDVVDGKLHVHSHESDHEVEILGDEQVTPLAFKDGDRPAYLDGCRTLLGIGVLADMAKRLPTDRTLDVRFGGDTPIYIGYRDEHVEYLAFVAPRTETED